MTPLEEIVAKYGTPPEGSVSYLPRTTCRACTDSQQKVCSEHRKVRCQKCGNWITTAHIDLEYMGHAEVTVALSEIDPAWRLEFATTDGFSPAAVKVGKMWTLGGRLTLHDASRPGVGSSEDKPEFMKELIGDLLRNCAMRFGVGVNLWSKAERSRDDSDSHTASEPVNLGTRQNPEPAQAPVERQAMPLRSGTTSSSSNSLSVTEAQALRAQIMRLPLEDREGFKAEFKVTKAQDLDPDRYHEALTWIALHVPPETDDERAQRLVEEGMPGAVKVS